MRWIAYWWHHFPLVDNMLISARWFDNEADAKALEDVMNAMGYGAYHVDETYVYEMIPRHPSWRTVVDLADQAEEEQT